MSDYAILTSVVASLRELSEWDAVNCKAKYSANPDPVMGDTFCSVYMNEYQTKDQTTVGMIEEIYGFAITITKRLSAIPNDRISDSIYLENVSGISKLLNRAIIKVEANKGSIIQAIDSVLEDEVAELDTYVEDSYISEPFRFIYRQPKPDIHDEEWTHGTHGEPPRNAQDGMTTISLTAYFGKMVKLTVLIDEEC